MKGYNTKIIEGLLEKINLNKITLDQILFSVIKLSIVKKFTVIIILKNRLFFVLVTLTVRTI